MGAQQERGTHCTDSHTRTRTNTIDGGREHDQARVAKSPLDASFLQEKERARARKRCGRMRAKERASMRAQGLWKCGREGAGGSMLLCVRRDFFVDVGAAGRSELLLSA